MLHTPRALLTSVAALLTLALVAPTPGARSVAREPGLQDLDWLAGTWRHGEGESIMEETWVAPVGDSMVGMFRWVAEGKTSLFELMSIEQAKGEEPVFRIRHFSPGLRPWASEQAETTPYPLVDLGEERVTFENPEATDARRFLYELDEDGVLHVRVELAEGEPYVFELDRVE